MAELRDAIDRCIKHQLPPNTHREIEIGLKDINNDVSWRALNKSLRDGQYPRRETFCGIARAPESNDVRQKILFYDSGEKQVESKTLLLRSQRIKDTSYTIKCSAETTEHLITNVDQMLQRFNTFGYRYRIEFDISEHFRVDMTQLFWFKSPDYQSEFVNSLGRLRERNGLLIDREIASCLASKDDYQCEVEFINPTDTATLTSEFTSLYPVLQMSPLFVTPKMRANLHILYDGLRQRNKAKFMVEARNLKITDLTGEALLNAENPYTFTLKADGERKLLVLNADGIWLNYPEHLASLIGTKKFDQNSVYDCEVVGNQIFIFDCLIKNNEDIRNKPHLQRLSECRDLDISGTGYTVKLKEFFPIRSADDFFAIMNRQKSIFFAFEALQNFLNDNPKATEEEILSHTPLSSEGFHIDGFMFTPGGKYNTGLFSTNLVKNPMVCKWKPTSLLTIDFHLRLLSNGQKGLFCHDETTNTIEVFKGTEQYPYTPETLGQDQFADIPVGTIVEMRYSNGQFLLYRTRENKNTANSMRVAIDNWRDICRPLTPETLCGMNFQLVRKYHNRLKSRLLNTSIDRNSVILDIGSGVGGDLKKFAKAKHIYLVEPNTENLPELNERIRTHKMTGKVTVINAKFEEIETIRQHLKERINLVTSMFSLTFFWESRETLAKFVLSLTSLAPSARFLFATMEGHAVLALQRTNHWKERKLIMDAGLEKAVFERQPKESGKGHAIDVQIPGKTVQGVQREYLVFLSDLRLPREYKLQMYGKASDEMLLPPAGKLYSSFYVFGAFSVDKSVESALSEQFEQMRIVTELGKKRDDEVSDIIVSGYEGFSFKRIGNISLIGAILKAVSPAYQELQSIEERKKYCTMFQKYVHDNVVNVWSTTNYSYLLDVTIRAIFHGGNEFPPFPSEMQARLTNSEFTNYEIALIGQLLGVNIVILSLDNAIFRYAEINPPLCEGRNHSIYILKDGDFYDNILIRQNSTNFFVATDNILNDIMRSRVTNSISRNANDWSATQGGFKSLSIEQRNAMIQCAMKSDPTYADYLRDVFTRI